MISPLEAWTGLRTGLRSDLDTHSLLQWQLARLRETLTYAQDRSRFYGERLRGTDVASLAALADLERLPFTWPSDITRDPMAFLCIPQAEVARVTTLTTSGSTGEKKRIFFSRSDLERTVDFFAHGMHTMVSKGQDTLILMGGDTEHSIARLLQTGLARTGVTGRIGAPDWSVREILEAARTADCLVGLPAEVLYLCRTDASLRPESVLLSADFVPACVIEAIAKTWHCRVFTHFGMTETGFGCAVQCTAGEGHHLRHPDLLLEIVDPETGRQLPIGIRGEIVLTLLRNEAMPIVRYLTGDLSRMTSEPCGCGSVLPRLGRVDGRRENDLLLASGATLSIHQLDELLFAAPGVRGFAASLCREEHRDTLRLTIEAEGCLDQTLLTDHLPPDLELTLHYAEANPFSRRGKRRIEVARSKIRQPDQIEKSPFNTSRETYHA